MQHIVPTESTRLHHRCAFVDCHHTHKQSSVVQCRLLEAVHTADNVRAAGDDGRDTAVVGTVLNRAVEDTENLVDTAQIRLHQFVEAHSGCMAAGLVDSSLWLVHLTTFRC